jgi:hypothetical protein
MKYYMILFSLLLSRIARNFYFYVAKFKNQLALPEALTAMIDKCKKMTAWEFNEYIRKSFTYESDKIDYSKHPLMFIYDKKGDCDDYAQLAVKILPHMGYNVYLISVFADVDRGHAVCVGEKDGRFYGFGNWRLMTFEGKDFIKIGNEISNIGYQCNAEFILKFDSEWNLKEYYHK